MDYDGVKPTCVNQGFLQSPPCTRNGWLLLVLWFHIYLLLEKLIQIKSGKQHIEKKIFQSVLILPFIHIILTEIRQKNHFYNNPSPKGLILKSPGIPKGAVFSAWILRRYFRKGWTSSMGNGFVERLTN